MTDSGDASFYDFDQLVDVVCLDAVPALRDDDTFAFSKSQLGSSLDYLVHLRAQIIIIIIIIIKLLLRSSLDYLVHLHAQA